MPIHAKQAIAQATAILVIDLVEPFVSIEWHSIEFGSVQSEPPHHGLQSRFTPRVFKWCSRIPKKFKVQILHRRILSNPAKTKHLEQSCVQDNPPPR
jgi:hypothetical protein